LFVLFRGRGQEERTEGFSVKDFHDGVTRFEHEKLSVQGLGVEEEEETILRNDRQKTGETERSLELVPNDTWSISPTQHNSFEDGGKTS